MMTLFNVYHASEYLRSVAEKNHFRDEVMLDTRLVELVPNQHVGDIVALIHGMECHLGEKGLKVHLSPTAVTSLSTETATVRGLYIAINTYLEVHPQDQRLT